MSRARSPRRRALRLGATTAGAGLVGLLALVAVIAPWLAPFDPDEQLDPAVAASRPPLSSVLAVELRDGRVLLAEEITRRGDTLTLLARGRAQDIESELVTRIAPRRYLLGTDRLGRDVLSRLVFGARTSLASASPPRRSPSCSASWSAPPRRSAARARRAPDAKRRRLSWPSRRCCWCWRSRSSSSPGSWCWSPSSAARPGWA